MVGDSFDYLFKMVVIGGTVSVTQTRESANRICFPDSLQTNSVMNQNQQSAYNLPRGLST